MLYCVIVLGSVLAVVMTLSVRLRLQQLGFLHPFSPFRVQQSSFPLPKCTH